MDLVKQIEQQFTNAPSEFDALEQLLSTRTFTPTELATLAISFADNCFCEYRDALNPEIPAITIENMHSNHLAAAIKLLLAKGLDPNVSVNGENVMWATQYIDAPNVAPAVLQLLLEQGGNPNHCIETERESLFEYVNFKVAYDSHDEEYRHVVQCWLLLIAYGADISDIAFRMQGNHTVDVLKNYELFDYEIESLPPKPGQAGHWIMRVYNLKTKELVAIY